METTEKKEAEVWPKIETLENGGTKTTQKDGTYEITFQDGRRIECGLDQFEVTYNTDNSVEFILPRSKKHCKIIEGDGNQVLAAQREVGSSIDSDAFMKSLMSQLIRIDGAYVIPDDWGSLFKAKDFMKIQTYFSQVNF